jgi:hypothetical protein
MYTNGEKWGGGKGVGRERGRKGGKKDKSENWKGGVYDKKGRGKGIYETLKGER